MAYMTAKQAAGEWGLQLRQVQWLCQQGRVAGAVRFNRSWAIPTGAPRPRDGRTGAQPSRPPQTTPAPSPAGNPELFYQTFEHLPFSINISDMRGIMVYANAIFFRGTLPGTREKALGSYNILEERLLEQWGLGDHVARAFRGSRPVPRSSASPTGTCRETSTARRPPSSVCTTTCTPILF